MTTHAPRAAEQSPGTGKSGRHQTRATLQESEARLQALAENTSDILWEMDYAGVYTYLSPNVSLVTGYEPDEVLGKTVFDFMPSEDAERFRTVFLDLAASGKPFSRIERKVHYKDGKIGIMECSGKPIFDDHGQLKGYRGVERDITRRKAQEKQELTRRCQQIVSYLLPLGW